MSILEKFKELGEYPFGPNLTDEQRTIILLYNELCESNNEIKSIKQRIDSLDDFISQHEFKRKSY